MGESIVKTPAAAFAVDPHGVHFGHLLAGRYKRRRQIQLKLRLIDMSGQRERETAFFERDMRLLAGEDGAGQP